MRTLIRCFCWTAVLLALGWTIAIMLNGKILFDRTVIIAKDDVIVAMILMGLAIPAALLLLVTKPRIALRPRPTPDTDPVYVASLLDWAAANLRPEVSSAQLQGTAESLRRQYIEQP